MARRVFLSFLGTNNYVDCSYTFNGEKGSLVKYIQEDILKRFAFDAGFIFTTEESRKKNWEDYTHYGDKDINKGLKTRLSKYNYISQVDIPFGKNEVELWEIFQILYDKIEEGDDIVFDITHSFRSLPMLTMVFLNYVKLLKKVKVLGIYYGAFENLGSAYEVKQMATKNRVAPIFDLSSLSALQDWTMGVNNFINLGNVDKIKQLTMEEINPLLRQSRGQDKTALLFKQLSNKLEDFTKVQTCCRGADLYDMNIKKITEMLDSLKNEKNLIPAYGPLIDEIKQQLTPFLSKNTQKGIECVEWLYRNGQYQQSITMLQETVISFFLEKDGRNINSKKEREIVNSVIAVISRNISEDKWNKILVDNNITNNSNIYKYIYEAGQLLKYMDSLSQLRNDINHGGMKRDKGDCALNYKDLLKKLKKLKDNIIEELKNDDTLHSF